MSSIITFAQSFFFILLALLQPSVPGFQGPDGAPGLPAWDTVAFSEAMLEKNLTPRANITFDEMLAPVMERVEEHADFSVPALLGLLPDPFYPFRPVARLLSSPIAQAQAALNAWSKSLSDPDSLQDDLIRFASVTLGMAKEVQLACEPLGEPGLYEIIVKITYEDGRKDQMRSGVYYDTERDLVYGPNGKGFLSLGFDYEADKRLMYAREDVWQRSFGFTEAYDIMGANSGLMRFDTVRFKFPYAGRDWMIQLWKGRHIIGNGGEVGLYHKPANRLVEFYDCAGEEDYLPISIRVSLAHNGEVLVDRPTQPHWWMTGFHLSDRYYYPGEMVLDTTIAMKDHAMLEAFRAALDQQADAVDYTVKGLLVSIHW